MKERIIEALKFEATKDKWRGNFSSNEFKICDQLNYELFGKHFNKQKKCECIEDFFLLLKSRLEKLNFKSINMNKLFKLKQGTFIQSFDFPDGISEFSSDADCLKLLKSNPKTIKHFESVPEGWEDMEIKEEVEVEAETDWKTLSVKKIKALALQQGLEITATAKADVIETYENFLSLQESEEVEEVQEEGENND
jgi:hypothetical protein